MKKIIAAFDGLKLSESTMNYAIHLAGKNGAALIGVFLDDFTYTSYKVQDLVYAEGGLLGPAKKNLDKKDAKKRTSSVEKFEMACQVAALPYTIHRDRSIAIQEILRETIYADLLIVDRSETFSVQKEELPTEFIRDLLNRAHCPVLLVPPLVDSIRKLVFLYDGSPSSVYAIKMFCYTLPALRDYPAEIVTVITEEESEMPDNILMKEFLEGHLSNITYSVLGGIAESEIPNHLKKQEQNTIAILGAYGRGLMSRWLSASMADTLMQGLHCPLFIAHNK